MYVNKLAALRLHTYIHTYIDSMQLFLNERFYYIDTFILTLRKRVELTLTAGSKLLLILSFYLPSPENSVDVVEEGCIRQHFLT